VSGLFAIAGSYGIAFTEYQGLTTGLTQLVPGAEPGRFHERLGGFGLSWVSLFIVVVSVIVPTPPRRAAASAAIAISSVPVAFSVGLLTGHVTVIVTPLEFFFFLVFPYIWVIVVAYFGARVVYRLGAAVRQARELGSYRLIERLGAGGMGEVWRADHRLLARPAAIKLVRPEKLGGLDLDGRRIMMKRFEREAQATAAMQCPHTVQIFDFGVSSEGAFYYVMELLDGLDADTIVKRFGPMPAERVVHVLRQVCASLAEAHERGLVHRDVKPANIYLCRYGREADFVKVLDFGLVKSHADRGVAEPGLTDANAISGTPAYLAPEQIIGDHPIDGRTDLYALGCVAYWLLTGRLVFEGRTVLDTIVQHVEARPIPPSRLTAAPIPAELERSVLACLAKDPAKRPATADALADALTAVQIADPWTPQRAREWWDTNLPVPRPAPSTSS
jgi:serine/threonine-protein kinase